MEGIVLVTILFLNAVIPMIAFKWNTDKLNDVLLEDD